MDRFRGQDEDGNILIAMLGIVIVTFICLIGMTQMVLSEKVSRHDRNFEQALAAAETGLDKLLTQVRATPLVASVPPVTGSDAGTSTTYSAIATGGSGHWQLTSRGTATGSSNTVTRTIVQKVDVDNLLAQPLFGTESVTIGGAGTASGVDVYDSAVSSSVCAANGSAQSMGYNGARMCTHATPALGQIGTNGPLTLPGAALSNVSGADIFDTGVAGYPDPDDKGTCVGDSAACAAVGTTVTKHEDPLDFPLSTLCANGVGAGAAAYDGSLALAANAVYSFTDVTLNATAIANLQNISGSQLVICFSGELDILPVLPINSTIETLVPLRLAPRAPSTLILISTAPASGKPTIKLNTGLAVASSVSAVIYAPNADCTATAHVDIYGALVCGTISAPSGINVHYDTEVGKIAFDQPITVSDWREQ
jgi:Tfp pilus assembly protein PilX